MNRNNEKLEISLRGDINETSEPGLRELLSKIDGPKAIFNLEEIQLVNSLGARYWIEFVKYLPQKCRAIEFQKCSIAFIECCNIYPKFAPRRAIVSLYVPIDCPKCGNDGVILCERSQLAKDMDIPQSPCASCSALVEPLVPLEEYLQCLKDL